MFAIIKDKKLVWFTDYKPTQENMSFDEIIEWDFDINRNYKYEDGVIVDITPLPPVKTEEEIKQEKISEYKKIETEVIKKSEEYKNTELLPDWVLKTMKLEKVLSEKNEIEKKFNDFIENLVIEYWENILNELI